MPDAVESAAIFRVQWDVGGTYERLNWSPTLRRQSWILEDMSIPYKMPPALLDPASYRDCRLPTRRFAAFVLLLLAVLLF